MSGQDRRSLEQFVGRMHPRLVRFARSMLPSDTAAEEVAQETWLAVLNAADSFDGRSSPETWILAIAKNLARKELARHYRQEPHCDPGPEEAEPLAGRFFPAGHPLAGHWSDPPSQGLLPENQVVSEELASEVRRAIDDLPARPRQVVLLREIVGLEPAEVEAVLGIDTDNQRTILHRARAKLRARLERYREELR